MPEDPKPAEGEEPDPKPAEPEKKDPPKDDDPDAPLLAGARDPDAVRNALRSEREAAKEAKKRAEAAEAKAKEYEDREKSEQQKLEEKAAETAKRADAADLKALRYEVAADKGLDLKWASRLSGTTKEELEKDAEGLAKEFKGERPGFDGGTREPATTDNPDDAIRRMAGHR